MISFSKLVRHANQLLRNIKKYRTPLLIGISLLVFGLTQVPWAKNSPSLLKLKGLAEDTRFLTRHRIEEYSNSHVGAHPQVALVGINQSSLDQGLLKPFLEDSPAIGLMSQGAWPFPRATYAYVLDRLFALGAKTIVIDILYFTGRPGDDELAAAFKRHAGKVVIACTTVSQQTEDGGTRYQFIYPNPELEEAITPAGIGYAYFKPDAGDNVVRRARLRVSKYAEMGHPEMSSGNDLVAFSALGVSKFLGQDPGEGSQIINYRGGAGTVPVIPIEEIFSDRLLYGVKGPDGKYLEHKGPDPRFQGPNGEAGGVFKDKIVFLGPISETFHDEHPTPLGTMPGVEIHAQLASALLDNTPILEFPEKYEIWIVLGMVAVAFALLLKVEKVMTRMFLGVFVVLGYAVSSYWLFANHRLMIPVVIPLLALLSISGVITLLDFAVEQLERAHVRSVLDKYVSSNVASLVIGQGDSFEDALRGKTKPVSVLFSDIRSFTTLSESRSPELLVAQLNEYFLPMVDKVLTQGGTLQKFIGDAIMAVWGDTHSLGLDVDARGAVRAAIQMRDALKVANAEWRERPDRVELSTGIGINHGRVVVGEVGHPKRMEFTVLGDGVNLAARLESSTKQFGCDILVGETAEALTRDHFVFRRVDRAVFKGKTEPIDVFTPVGEMGILVPDWLGRYHGAIDLYRNQEFSEAKQKFGEVLEELNGTDFLCKMYQKRCDHFMEEKPAPDWNGSWVLSEK
ncbi:MAG: adenylate/guanylate cyclase domain-containing protein [Verrucomicrobiota bacterium]